MLHPFSLRLISNKLRRFDERNHDDVHAAPLELAFERLHLAEVSAARQSGKVSEKDQKHIGTKALHEINGVAVQIDER